MAAAVREDAERPRLTATWAHIAAATSRKNLPIAHFFQRTRRKFQRIIWAQATRPCYLPNRSARKPRSVLANDPLAAFWMPFTANRAFKATPRLLVAAKDMHYTSADGRAVLDGTAGLWCVNAGHCRPRIVEAIQHAASTLDFGSTFQLSHPLAFELATRVGALMRLGWTGCSSPM